MGEDQQPHVELSREIARQFNQLYGATFPEPQALLSPTPRLPGIDNRTMHTSYENAIYLKDTPEETRRKVMSMFTDPTRIHASDPGHVEGNPVFDYLEIFDNDKAEVEEFKTLYRTGKIGDVALKSRLADSLNLYLEPLRESRQQLSKDPDHLKEVLYEGTQKARIMAELTLGEVQQKMGLPIRVAVRSS